MSDGSKLLISNFGPKLKTGDKVGLIAKITEEGKDYKLKMYFMLNDQPLGLAFNLPLNTLTGLYPVVKLNGKGSVSIDEMDSTQVPAKIEPNRILELEGKLPMLRLT